MTQLEQMKQALDQVRETIQDLVRGVVTQPDGVSVTAAPFGTLVAFTIKTEKDDVRRVIGSKGKHFKALEVICRSMLKMMDLEAHLTVDDKGPPLGGARPRAFQFGSFDPKRFGVVTGLLRKTLAPFVNNPEKLSVKSTDLGTTAIVEVEVANDDFPFIYGPTTAQFEYGEDGILIGSIKNIFDGIGKNHGRVIRMVVNKV